MKKSTLSVMLAAAAWAHMSLAQMQQGNGNGNGSTNGNGNGHGSSNGNGGAHGNGNGNGSTNGNGDGSSLDLQALKAKCIELSGNQQIKAFKALVTCRDTRLIWREAAQQKPERFSLQNSREVGAAVKMKSFDLPYSGSPVPIQATTAPCMVLDQWKIIVPAVEVELSCDELNNIEDLNQYCVGVIDERVQTDASQTIEEQTGERFNSCAQSSANTQSLTPRRGAQAGTR